MTESVAGQPGNPRLFISHHSSKYQDALRVEQALAQHGISCWIAPRDVEPGEAFDTAIMNAIRDSAAVLLLFCSRSDKSQHVKRELNLADNARKTIIPLRLEEFMPEDLAYHLASAQWIDWLKQHGDITSRIAAKVHQLAEQSPSQPRPQPRPQPPEPPTRRDSQISVPPGPDAAARSDQLHGALLREVTAAHPSSGKSGIPNWLLVTGGLSLFAIVILGALMLRAMSGAADGDSGNVPDQRFDAMGGGNVAPSSPAPQGQVSGPDPTLNANYGAVALSSGFTPDPYSVNVVAGGTFNAASISGCTGNISRAPDFELTYTAGQLPLAFRTSSGTDTTLVINGPDGRWYCDDDSAGGNGDAQVVFTGAQSGVYDVWVGTYDSASAPATLSVTEVP